MNTHVQESNADPRTEKPFQVIPLKEEDIRADIIKSPWIPQLNEANLSPEQSEQFSKVVLKSSLLSGLAQDWVVSDEWNQLLPDYRFADVEEYLKKAWAEGRK